jgi:hypothetical protein
MLTQVDSNGYSTTILKAIIEKTRQWPRPKLISMCIQAAGKVPTKDHSWIVAADTMGRQVRGLGGAQELEGIAPRVLLHETVLEATLGPVALAVTQTAMGCKNSRAVPWTKRMATRSTLPKSFICFGALPCANVTQGRPHLPCSIWPASKIP